MTPLTADPALLPLDYEPEWPEHFPGGDSPLLRQWRNLGYVSGWNMLIRMGVPEAAHGGWEHEEGFAETVWRRDISFQVWLKKEGYGSWNCWPTDVPSGLRDAYSVGFFRGQKEAVEKLGLVN